MLNVVAIIGRLAASPELKTTNSGKSVCSFRIANDSGYKDASGQNQTYCLGQNRRVCLQILPQRCADRH